MFGVVVPLALYRNLSSTNSSFTYSKSDSRNAESDSSGSDTPAGSDSVEREKVVKLAADNVVEAVAVNMTSHAQVKTIQQNDNFTDAVSEPKPVRSLSPNASLSSISVTDLSSSIASLSNLQNLIIPSPPPSPSLGHEPSEDSITRLFRQLNSMSHNEFRLVQRAVLANVSAGIKLSAYVGARYTEELIIWTDSDTERANNRDSALRFYESAALVEPDNAFIPYRQGVLLWDKHEWTDALQHLGIASLLADADSMLLFSSQLKARIHFFMGRCLEQIYQDNNFPSLIRQRQAHLAAVRHDPLFAQAYHDLGQVYYELDDYESCVHNLQQAMWLDPYREATTSLLLINDYQGHDYVKFTNDIVFQLGFSWKALEAKLPPEPHKKHKLVFCINSGRSGSHFLATVFRTLKGRHFGFHEPMPQTQWHELTLDHPLNHSYNERKEKAQVIKRVLEKMPSGSTYSETSLNFITQFQDVVMGEFSPDEYEISVILLRRNLAKSLKSIMDVGWFDDNMRKVGEQWDRWTHSLESANAVLKPVAPFENLTRAEKVIGYLIDIEARAQKFRRDYPDVRVFETDLDELNDRAHLSKLLQWMGEEPGPVTFQHLGQYTNNKDTSKGVAAGLSDTGRHNTYELCVREILQYLVRCHQLDIEVPPLPHFQEYHLLAELLNDHGHQSALR